MRKRRMYRYSQQQVPRFEHEYPINANEARQIFSRGVSAGLRAAAGYQRRSLAEMQRNAVAMARHETYTPPATQGGWQEGFAAGMRAVHQTQGQKQSQFTYEDVERARRRGYEEGRLATPPSGANEANIRTKMVDEMMEQCRVISESNPNMAPGVNAVKHLIKKMK